MGERFPGDGAAANGFGRRTLHEWEAHLLHQANYPASPDMRAPGRWRLSTGGVLVPPQPDAEHPAYFHDEIERVRASLPEEVCGRPEYAADNHASWAAYFQRRHEEQLASTNNAPVRGRHNADGCRLWWDVPGRTLHFVLEHLEGGNQPPLQYPTAPAPIPRQSGGGIWLPRRMAGGSSSSSSHSHSPGSPALASVKPEPVETPLGRRTRGGALVINEGGRGSSSSRLVKPKTEPGLVTVKSEHADMAALDDEAAIKWAREDYIRLETERQRRALEEFSARRHGRDEGGVIVLEDSDDDDAAPPPTKPIRQGDAGQGCSTDGGGVKKEADNGGDYSAFSAFFGL